MLSNMNKECHYLVLDGECIHNEQCYQISLATFILNTKLYLFFSFIKFFR